MGHQRSCEKAKTKCKKGLWSPEEDRKLRDYVLTHGHSCWSAVPVEAGLQRNGKSCRLRWINYLRPGLKRGAFTPSEENIVLTLHSKLGNKWAHIAAHLPGRTDNEVKNYWNSYLKKRVKRGAAKAVDRRDPHKPEPQATESTSLASNGPTRAKNYGQSSLPKIFFADWLLMEGAINGQSGKGIDSGEATGSVDYVDDATITGDAFALEAICPEGSTSDGFLGDFGEASISHVLEPEFELGSQAYGDVFLYSFSASETCVHIDSTQLRRG